MKIQDARVALVHDWLVTYAGAERVLAELVRLFPAADLFAVVDFLTPSDRRHLGGKRARTTFIQGLPLAARQYRSYLPLMPLAIEQLDLSAYDLVISSSHAVAKGVITGPDQLHVAYVHTPMRYAWDLQHQYLREERVGFGPKGLLVRSLLHRLRAWDVISGQRPDVLVANSAYIARRIQKAYRRVATVVHPPVDVESFVPGSDRGDFFLTASRMVPYKRIDLVVEAFTKTPDRTLVVVGDGPDMAKIARRAGPNVRLLGGQPFDRLKDLMQRARAFVFAAEEDFGIMPVEAQACGTPVIAYGRGGAVETVVGRGSHRTGVFFGSQTAEAVNAAVDEFEGLEGDIDPDVVRRNALRFSTQVFRDVLNAVLVDAWRQHGGEKR